MAGWRPIQRMSLVAWTLSCLVTAATAQQSPDLKQTVKEVVSACALGGPTSYFEQALSSNLEDFLRQAIETKSADPVMLDNLLERLPTNTDEMRAQLKSERARQTFFAIYFDCIRHQVSLKLKSLGIAFG